MQFYKFQTLLVPDFSSDKLSATLKYSLKLASGLNAGLVLLKFISFEVRDAFKEDMGIETNSQVEELLQKHNQKFSVKLEEEGFNTKKIRIETVFSDSREKGLRQFLSENKISLVILDRQLNDRDNRIQPLMRDLKIPVLIQKNNSFNDLANQAFLVPCNNRKSHLSSACQAASLAKALNSLLIFIYSSGEFGGLNRENCPVDVLYNIEICENFARENGIPFKTVFRSDGYTDGIIQESIQQNADLILMGGSMQDQFSGSMVIDSSLQQSFKDLREGILDSNSDHLVEQQSECNFVYSNNPENCTDCNECHR